LELELCSTPKWCHADLPFPQESFTAGDKRALVEVPGNWKQSGFWIMYVALVQRELRGQLTLEQLSYVKSQPVLRLCFFNLNQLIWFCQPSSRAHYFFEV